MKRGDISSEPNLAMCLAVPGKVVAWIEQDPLFAMASVEFGAMRRAVSMACTPDVEVGDYVLVHAGIAISRIDPDEAARVLAMLRDLGLDESVGVASD